MRFEKGKSGNPGGRPKAVQAVVDTAREHTALAIATLAEIAEDKTQPAAARATASSILLDRGWGKPQTNVTLDAGSDLAAVIDGWRRKPGE
jgi:hypothetical protein